eukprot:TRINITY_DN6527_c0_g1_i1.p1 TRINITY_DN6527_c0_g1~~TRINITY_DN6527_c0_g1_i1.p1  ORF type:complete len:141 (+),score=10.85 TRINITY_DN6527_c0_g1_i1:16-438(+)
MPRVNFDTSFERMLAIAKNQKECDQNNFESCYKVGLISLFMSNSSARTFLQKGCRGGKLEACSALGLYYLYNSSKQTDSQVFENRGYHLLDQACHKGEKNACEFIESKQTPTDFHNSFVKLCGEDNDCVKMINQLYVQED